MLEPASRTELAEKQSDIQLRDCLFVVLQRRWLIAAVFSSVLLVTAIYSLLQIPRYNATALIQITQSRINLAREATIEDGRTKSEEFYSTQTDILKSRSLSERVMDELDLWQHPLFAPAEPNPDLRPAQLRAKQVEDLRQMLRVSPIANTQLVRVGYTTSDPELSASLANSLAKQYIGYSAEAASGVARYTTTFIREQVEKLQAQIAENEAKLQEFSQQEDFVVLDEGENFVVRQLHKLNAELADVQAERAEAEAHFLSLRREEPDAFPEILDNRVVQDLKRERAGLQKRHAELSSRFKPNYPEVERTRSALEEVERRLDDETNDVGAKVLAAARVRYETALRRERILRRTLQEQRQEARDINASTGDYHRVRVELDNQRIMLEQLLQRKSETGLTAELGERAPTMSVRLVDEAVAPRNRSSPNHRVNLLVGGTLGMALGIGLAFFLNFWDASLQNTDDLRRYVALPLLGTIPRDPTRLRASRTQHAMLSANSVVTTSASSEARSFEDSLKGFVEWCRSRLHRQSRSIDLDLPMASVLVGGAESRVPMEREESTDSTPSSLIDERFKFLRSALLLSSAEGPPKTVLVTSSTEAEGKSFIACGLAACLTELDKKVLLIDADLRRPVHHEVFQTGKETGLTSVLTGLVDIKDGCIHATPVPNLFVVPAGPSSPAPAELLGSSAMDTLLGRLGDEFDFVVVDSAPLLPVIDSHSLARLCDAVVLVTRAGQTSRHAVNASKELIETSHGRITGVVLNDVDVTDFAHSLYYQYQSYAYGDGASRRKTRSNGS